MYYLDTKTGRLVSSSGRTTDAQLRFVKAQTQTFEFALMTNSETQTIPAGAELWLVGKENLDDSVVPLFRTPGVVADDRKSVVFEVDTYTEEYISRITMRDTPILVELGVKYSGATYINSLALLDATANPRPYVAGTPPASAEYYYDKDEINTILGTPPARQFSVDGETGWHDTQSVNDRYYREQAAGVPVAWRQWGDAVALIVGPAGADGVDGTDGENGVDGANGTDGADGGQLAVDHTYIDSTYGTVCYLDDENSVKLLGYNAGGVTKLKLWMVSANADVNGNVVLKIGTQSKTCAVGAAVALVEWELDPAAVGLIEIIRDTDDAADTLKSGGEVVTALLVDWRVW